MGGFLVAGSMHFEYRFVPTPKTSRHGKAGIPVNHHEANRKTKRARNMARLMMHNATRNKEEMRRFGGEVAGKEA